VNRTVFFFFLDAFISLVSNRRGDEDRDGLRGTDASRPCVGAGTVASESGLAEAM
jgi:hypothetical protein